MSAPSGVDLMDAASRGPVHFMGVGGAGMNALAELVASRGVRVTGCDLKRSAVTERLEELGVEIADGHDPAHVAGASAVVVTSAVPDEHPELERARELGIPTVKRAEALGSIVNRGRLVAIAGTHGKTTTTALTAAVLAEGGLDPTGVVGGRVPSWDGNLRRGGDALFVVEADEYDRSFMALEPDVAVVTNVEADHLEVYGDLAGVRRGFVDFLGRLRNGGRVVLCADDHGSARLVPEAGREPYTYGMSAGSMLRAVDVEAGRCRTRFRAVEQGDDRGRFELAATGEHNLLNGLAASAVARLSGVEWDAIGSALASFGGVARRFERLGEAGGIAVVDDYAHHPTELRAALDAARSAYPGRRLVAVFQPHLFSRTRDFAGEFADALAEADVCWVSDVFPAREEPIPGVSGALVADAARSKGGVEVRYHEALDELQDALLGELVEGDVLLTLGAGSIESLGASVLSKLREEPDA